MSADWSAMAFHIIKSIIIHTVKILTKINMTASSNGFAQPSMEVFRQSVQSICPMFLVPSLHESQLQALYRFICGEDVFVNLPTGYDKSLIFQMAPLVHAWMHENLSTC